MYVGGICDFDHINNVFFWEPRSAARQQGGVIPQTTFCQASKLYRRQFRHLLV